MRESVSWDVRERAALRAARDGNDRRVARRADVLLATEGLTAAEGARSESISAATLVRWRQQFRSAGPDGLHDRQRSGRPRQTVSPTEVLRTLLMPTTTSWSSRAVARELGVSQSYVARVWTDAFGQEDRPALLSRGEGSLVPIGLQLSRRGVVLRLRAEPGGGQAKPSPHVLGAWRTVVVACQFAPELVRSSDVGPVQAESAAVGRGVVSIVSSDPAVTGLVEVEVPRWGSLVHTLAEGTARRAGPRLDDLVTRLRAWADRPTIDEFKWRDNSPLLSERPASDTEPSLIDDCVGAMCVVLQQGRLQPEERFSAAWVAGQVGASTESVRMAMRQLVDDGLVVRRQDRAFHLPVPTSAEVLEVYAARRSLGALLVRRAAQEGGDLQPARAALATLRAAADAGDTERSGLADLQFQDALARAAGAARIAALFQRLTQQLRLFIAVLSLRYAYSANSSLRDDFAILDHISRGDADAAAAAWNDKMSRAVGYMVRQLPAKY